MALAIGLPACSSTKNPLPSPFVGNSVDHPVSCAELQGAQIVDKAIQLDGGVPNCGADGLRCPLSGVTKATATSVCGSKNVVASCEQNRWVLACEAQPDGSAPLEAGADAADTDAGDAATDANTD